MLGLLASSVELFGADAPSEAPAVRSATTIIKAAGTKTGLRDQLRSHEQDTVVVFIPGILGSTLRIPTAFGTKTFGVDALEAWWLFYDPALDAVATTLNSFTSQVGPITIPRTEIYGPGLDSLKRAIYGHSPREFAYDWRADLELTVARLQDYLSQPEIKGKNVVIVAHSMGGVIAWHWLKTRSNDRPAVVLALLLVGSPLQGSCEPVRMLIEGYGASETSGVWESRITRWLFRDAHAAMFSFPSMFQLMPRFAPDKPCVVLRSGDGSVSPQDHHDPGFWMGRETNPTRVIASNHLGARRTEHEFRSAFQNAIAAGRTFRSKLDLSPLDVPTYFLYSKSRAMREQIEVEESDGWFRLVGNPPKTKNGDGRVLKRSAVNDGAIRPASAMVVASELDAEHGALLSDRRFAEFVMTNVAALVHETHALRTLGFFIAKNPSHIFAGGRVLVSFDNSPMVAFGNSETAFAKSEIAKFNLRQVVGQAQPSQEGIARSLAYVRKRGGNAPYASIAILESIVVLDKAAVTADDAVLGAKAAAKVRKDEKALQFTVIGLQKAQSSTTSNATAKSLAEIFKQKSSTSPNMLWRDYRVLGGELRALPGRSGADDENSGQGGLLFAPPKEVPMYDKARATDLLLRHGKERTESKKGK